MKRFRYCRFLGRGVGIFLMALLCFSIVIGQNIVVSGGGSFSGSGTIKVIGNINTTGATADVSFGGTVELNGTSTQTVGGGTRAITFATVKATAVSTKSLANNTTVTTLMDVASGTTTKFQLAQDKKLTLRGSISKSGTATTPYDFTTNTGTEVDYAATSGSAQAVYGTTYRALTMSGSQGFTVAADATANGAISHTGGSLNINNGSLTANAAYTFGTISDIANTRTLTLSATGGSISQVTDITSGGKITNGSGTLAITTLSNNHGIIENSTNNGPITVTNAAINSGTITGGTGLITFNNTLANAGTITSGSGGVSFAQAVTRNTGNAISSSAGLLNFGGNVTGTAGTIALTGTGSAEFAGTIDATGLSFATGTSVTYDGTSAGQAIADVSYGYLTLKSSTKAWTLGATRTINNNLDVQASSATTISGSYDLNVSGNITLASNLTKSANAIVFANATSTVGSGAATFDIIGSVTRTHTFAAATAYTFNNSGTTVQINSAPGGMTFTLNSQPSTYLTGYQAGHTVYRTYTASSTGFTSGTADIKLGYLQAEGSTLGVTEAKLKDFQTQIATGNKITGTPTRVTSGATSFGSVAYAGLANTLFSSSTQLALDDRFNLFKSIAATNWNINSTWDANDIPGSTDDVEVDGRYAVTVPAGYAASAYSVLISNNGAATQGGLTIAATTSITVGAGGLTNNNTTGAGFTVQGTATINGSFANAGNFTADGASAVVNANAGLNNSGSLAVNNAGGQLTISGGDFENSGTITNDGTITVE